MKKLTIFAINVAILFASSCSKHNHYSSTGNGSYSTTNSLFAAMAPQTKTVTLNAATGGSFTGNSGTRYIIPPSAFVTASGASVTGTVTIQATEFVSNSDMAFSGVLPISSGQTILSGGEFNMMATQGGQPLKIAPGKTFQVNLPQGDVRDTNMMVFVSNGKFDPADTTGRNNWVPREDTTHRNYCYPAFGDTLSMITDTMGYINADAFMSPVPVYQDFDVKLDAGGIPIDSTVRCFAVYDTHKSMWRLGIAGAFANGSFHEKHVPSIPVHFVAAAVIKGEIYAGSVGATPVTGGSYTVKLNKTTQAELKKMLDNK